MSVIEQITLECQKRGIRFTEDRRVVFEIICGSKVPLKAYDILEELKRVKKNAEPPTVYRALEFLEKNGFVHKVNILNSYFACSHFADQHACQLFICTKCQTAQEFCNANIASELKERAQKNNFQTQKISVEILGICKNCQ